MNSMKLIVACSTRNHDVGPTNISAMYMQMMPTTANIAKNICQYRRASGVKLKPKNTSISGIASMKRNRIRRQSRSATEKIGCAEYEPSDNAEHHGGLTEPIVTGTKRSKKGPFQFQIYENEAIPLEQKRRWRWFVPFCRGTLFCCGGRSILQTLWRRSRWDVFLNEQIDRAEQALDVLIEVATCADFRCV